MSTIWERVDSETYRYLLPVPEGILNPRLVHTGKTQAGNKVFSIVFDRANGETKMLEICYNSKTPRTRWVLTQAKKNAEGYFNA